MKVMIKSPCEIPRIEEIPNDMNVLQAIVGGYVEEFRLADDLLLLCDEEGRLKDRQHCFTWGRVRFFGTVIFVGVEEEDGELHFADFPYSTPIAFYEDMLVRGFMP